MKKNLFTFCLFLIASVALNAQEPLFNKGDRVINLGIGLGSVYYYGAGYSTGIPPLSASFELGMVDNFLDVENLTIGVGGYAGFATYRYRYRFTGFDSGWNYTTVILGARGAIHYPLAEKLDTYTGLLIGPRIVVTSNYGIETGQTSTARGSGLAYSYFFGARYYLGENFALLAELGYGISYLNFGIAFRF